MARVLSYDESWSFFHETPALTVIFKNGKSPLKLQTGREQVIGLPGVFTSEENWNCCLGEFWFNNWDTQINSFCDDT